RARRAARPAQRAGRRHLRRRRLHVHRHRNGDRDSPSHPAGDHRVQRRRVRQCPAHPAGALRQPPDRQRLGQSGFRRLRQEFWRRGGARQKPGRVAPGVTACLRAPRRADADRSAGGSLPKPVGIHPHAEGPRAIAPQAFAKRQTGLATRLISEQTGIMPMSSAAAVSYSMHPIITTSELAAACKRMAAHPFVTIDTEFLRETTYYPLLCVAQMASPDEAVVVDALAPGIDLAPFYALMADERVMKVFHAARQDIEIVWHAAKLIPHPIFDTQVAAMVLGYGDSISYDQLVQRITGDTLDKSHRFTDWTRRPLSDAQLTYAVSDVPHLRDVYQALVDDLGRRGLVDWVQEEMHVLTAADTYRMDPENAWQRLKTRVRKPKELAVLIEVAGWRGRGGP